MNSPTPSTLNRLPAEIRLLILKYLLPRQDRVVYETHTTWGGDVVDGHLTQKYLNNRWTRTYLTPLDERATHGILTVNRKLYAEACAVMQLQDVVPHEIIINANSFYGQNPEDMMDDVKEAVIPEWKDVFPDTDLSKVRGLVITITPQAFPGFWPCLAAALQILCQDVLSQRKLPGKMTINLRDMESCWDLDYTPQGLWNDAEMVKACLSDYKAALAPFIALAHKIDFCHINLPYCMEYANGIAGLQEELKNSMSAHMKFMPPDLEFFDRKLGDGDTEWEDLPLELEDGAPVRWGGWVLADLANEELENSKWGLKEKFAATGSWV